MRNARTSRRGFTLVELVVVGAIGGMLFALAAPALQKGREDLHRRRCANNLRQLSMGMLAFENVNGGLPPMARTWTDAQYSALNGGLCGPPGGPCPGGWNDDHGWYSLVGPYIGYNSWASLLDFSVSMSHSNNELARRRGFRLKVHACPADIGLQRVTWFSSTWARVRSNYVVNAGNTNYGQLELNGVPFLGAPFGPVDATPLASISDGVASTLMMSEVVVFPSTTDWGGVYSETQTALGGQVFSGYNAPDGNVPDAIGRGRCGALSVQNCQALFAQQGIPFPVAAGSGQYGTYIAARSKHAGGVNASHCDGSVAFYNNDIDPGVWRALTTAQGADAPLGAATKPPRKRK